MLPYDEQEDIQYRVGIVENYLRQVELALSDLYSMGVDTSNILYALAPIRNEIHSAVVFALEDRRGLKHSAAEEVINKHTRAQLKDVQLSVSGHLIANKETASRVRRNKPVPEEVKERAKEAFRHNVMTSALE